MSLLLSRGFGDADQSENVGDNLLIMRARERNVLELENREEEGERSWVNHEDRQIGSHSLGLQIGIRLSITDL